MCKKLLLMFFIVISMATLVFADDGLQLSIGANTNISLTDLPDNKVSEHYFLYTSLYVEVGFAARLGTSIIQPGISLIIRQNPVKAISSYAQLPDGFDPPDRE